MEILVRPSAADYFKAVKYITRRMFHGSRLGYVVSFMSALHTLFIFVAIGLLAALLSHTTGSLRSVTAYALGSIALAFIIGIGSKVVYELCARRVIYRPDGYGLSPHRFSIEEQYLHHTTRQSETRLAWSDIEAVERTAELLFIFLDRGFALYIPRRAFPDQASYERFHEELGARLQKRAT